jgi:hypothetical protein
VCFGPVETELKRSLGGYRLDLTGSGLNSVADFCEKSPKLKVP